jgi:hypothetical protein
MTAYELFQLRKYGNILPEKRQRFPMSEEDWEEREMSYEPKTTENESLTQRSEQSKPDNDNSAVYEKQK